MLRLAHRILDQWKNTIPLSLPKEAFGDDAAIERAQSIVEGVRDKMYANPQVIIADNVYDYLRGVMQQDGLLEADTHFANLAPPFKTFFIEANIHCWFQQMGWLCTVIDSSDSAFPLEFLGTGVKWVLTMRVIITHKNGDAAITFDQCSVGINADGSYHAKNIVSGFLAQEWKAGWKTNSVTDLNTDRTSKYINSPAEVIEAIFSAGYSVPLLTINFMNCRNVIMVDTTEKEGPPKKWLRRRKQPGLSYRTVTIDPEKPKRGHSKSGGGAPTKTCPFHICRGHFVTYTDANGSKGMFGNGIYGTFWVPSHTRGDKKNGQTITTYNVKAPATEEGK